MPAQNLVGRAEMIFFSVRDGYAAWQFWRWPWSCSSTGCSSRCGDVGGAQDLTPAKSGSATPFLNIGLLRLALTHVSATGKRVDSYQRLEFLGDRVLGLVVADMLYEKFPDAPGGDLSRRSRGTGAAQTCVEIALEWDVAPP